MNTLHTCTDLQVDGRASTNAARFGEAAQAGQLTPVPPKPQ